MTLSDREIHVWSVGLAASSEVIGALSQTLSLDERERASRYHFEVHRNAYILTRSLLRSILSAYLEIEPKDITISYGARGKPGVAAKWPLHFNLSQSKELALFAFAQEPMLGVDVEWIRPMSDHEAVARRFFSSGECTDFLSLGPTERVEAFYNCWTRKEAYVKATGDGLYAPLDRFQVTLIPEQPAAFVSIDGDRNRASEWSLFDLQPAAGYAGAIAVYGQGWTIREWRCNDPLECLGRLRQEQCEI